MISEALSTLGETARVSQAVIGTTHRAHLEHDDEDVRCAANEIEQAYGLLSSAHARLTKARREREVSVA